MANLKNIVDLPVAESTEGLNLIVNDNGSAKQIAASAVGAQADWAEMDENSPAFVKNKPVEEWDLDLAITLSIDQDDNRSHEYIINSKKTFEEIKNKIINGIPLNNKISVAVYLFPDAVYPAYVSLNRLLYYYLPSESEGEGSPEYITFEIEGLDYMVTLLLNPDDTVVDVS
jgi:hypothetical protein